MGANHIIESEPSFLHGSFWNIIYVLQDNRQFGIDGPGGTIDLLWYRHVGYADGSNVWDGPRPVGTGWVFNTVFPRLDLLYAVTEDGRLLWYAHLGSPQGENRWEGPRPIGEGFAIRITDPSASDFVGVFCDTRNPSGGPLIPQPPIIYAVRANGNLLWYRHDGYIDGSPSWANNGQPRQVGEGWVEGYSHVFSGCNGIIYLIRDDGVLKWYKHTGYQEGTQDWEAPTEIGNGWGKFRDVFSLGEGIIYAIDQNGTMWWYKHKGYRNGTPDWEGPRKLSDGWDARKRVICNSAGLKTTHIG